MAARYVHVSVQVGRNASGELLRTPPGKGATARRSKEQEYMKRRDVRKEVKRMIREENKAAQANARSQSGPGVFPETLSFACDTGAK